MKLATMGEGDKTGLTRDEPRGTMLELGLRQNTQLKCVHTNAHSMGNKQEELEVIVRQANYDRAAITKTWWDHSHDCCDGWLQHLQEGQTREEDWWCGPEEKGQERKRESAEERA